MALFVAPQHHDPTVRARAPWTLQMPSPGGLQTRQAKSGHVLLERRAGDIDANFLTLGAVCTLALLMSGVQRRRRHRCKRLAFRATSSIVGQYPVDKDAFDVVVVGAGLSGLSAAYALQKGLPSKEIIVTEASGRVGGNINTCEGNGRLWEEGPNSFQPSDEFLGLACDLGLQDDIMLANPKSYRYVWHNGSLRALPSSLKEAVFGDFLSLRGKIRAMLGAFGWKKRMPDGEESIKEFIVRNLGTEAFDRLVDPFISGVYAGDPAKLSAEAAFGKAHALEKTYGSLMAGARKRKKLPKPERDPRLPEVKGQTVGSFRRGLSQFSDALAARVETNGSPVCLSWSLSSITWDASREEHVLVYETPAGKKSLRCRSLVITCPAWITAKLLRPLSESAAAALEEIEYPRVAGVITEYPRSAFREPEHGKGVLNGFGQLHPRSQGIRTLGTIYCSSLFPERMPDPEKVMLLSFIGGAQDPKLHGGIAEMSDGELVDIAHADIATTLLKQDATAMKPQVLGVKVWPRAIPQFDVGHSSRLQRASAGPQLDIVVIVWRLLFAVKALFTHGDARTQSLWLRGHVQSEYMLIQSTLVLGVSQD